MKVNRILPLIILLLVTSSLFSQKYERYKKLNDITINSKYLGFEKKISLTVPLEWQNNLNQKFPIILIFDSQNSRSHNYIINSIDYLTSNEQIPSSIIVSVESEQRYRYKETQYKISDENGLGFENEKFIFEELIKLLENEYRASKFRLFIGHSRYGYFTTSLFANKTNELNAVISLDPFFTQSKLDLTKEFQTLNSTPLKYKKYYRFSIGNDYPEDYNNMVAVMNNSKFNENLDLKGSYYEKAAHNSVPGLSISTQLYEIFKIWYDYQMQYLSPNQNDLKIKKLLDNKVLENYGTPIKFSLGTLNGKGWYFFNEKDYKKAIEAWEIMLESYPNFSEIYLYIIKAKKELNQDYSESLKMFHKSLVNSEFYTFEQKEELKNELNSFIN